MIRATLRDEDQPLAQRLRTILGLNAGPSFITFDTNEGTHVGFDWKGYPMSPAAIEEVRRSSLTAIFQESGGLGQC